MRLKIARILNQTERIRSFFLETADGGPLAPATAGAHIDLDLGSIGTRSYSIINLGDAAEYHIAVQRQDDGSGGSVAMHKHGTGDVLTAGAPKNDFPLVDCGPFILLAGGIGVTPLLALAHEIRERGAAFAFIYCGRSRDDMAFIDDHMVVHCDANDGPPDLSALLASLTSQTHLYVCGPKPMIEAAKALAVKRGLPANQIHFELFANGSPLPMDQPFEVEVASSGKVFTIPVGRSIIEVLEDAGMDIMYDCQRGDCGICQTDVIEGIPDHRDVVLSEAERASNKVMQICVSRAKTTRLRLDL
jgi:ferredoxin-NADP reductase